MPAQWTSRYTPSALSANDVGRTGMGFSQPFVQGTGIGAVNQGGRARYQTPYNPQRPYSQVGKMSINLGNLGGDAGPGGAGNQTKGFFQGLGAGAGELIGGIFGEEGKKIGSNIGGTIGGVAGTPFDIGGNLLGAVPAVPFLGGAAGMPGMGGKSVFDLPFMEEGERNKVLEGWDSNPFSLGKHMSEWNKTEWAAKVGAGEINPLFKDLAPAASIGDQVMQLMGVFGLTSNAVQRTLAGPGFLDAIDRISKTDDANLNPEIVELKHQYMDGSISRDRLLDELVMANAGYSNDWALNLLGSMVLDPLLIGGQVAGLAGKTALVGRLAKATKFTEMIGEEGVNALANAIKTRMEAAGKVPSAITGPEILEEAQRLGLHKDAIAEASRQISAKDQFGASIAHLEPIFNAAQNISDPFRMIGRIGSQPVLNAWKTSQAVMGVARAYNIGNFRKVQAVFDKHGILDRFNDGMGYFTSQEGMAMEGELLQQDVMATRRVVDARPTTVIEARLQAGSKNYSQRIETFVGRRKADVTRAFGLGTGEAAMTRARAMMSEKMIKMGLDPTEARKLADDLDADGLSMIDAAYYGYKIKQFNAAKRAASEAKASGRAAGPTPGVTNAADESVARTTFIGGRELSSGRAKTLRDTLEGDLTTAEKAVAGRDAIQRYDYLDANFSAVGPTDEEIVTGLIKWLDSFEDDLVQEMTDAQFKALPEELRNVIDPDDGYIYGLRPEGNAEWRVKIDPDDPTKMIASKPWVDTVGDAAQPWNTRFDANGTKVETMLNALERVMGQMSHQITTERIFGEARRSFIQKAIAGYSPNQTTALTYSQADALWAGVLDMAKTLKTSPRGMDMDEFAEVLKKVPAAAAAGITPRDLMGISLHSFEGRLSTVGVTQKISGTMKRVSFEVTGMNALGRVAERMYPMVRFSMNPFFQLQEWIEPWVFSAARGKKARLTGGWVDPITGTKVDPTEVMRLQDQLIQRYAAGNPYAQFDQMERSLVFLWGSKAAKGAALKTDIGKLEQGREMLARAATPGQRKAIAQSEHFRHFLGPILRDQLNSMNPTAWLELEMEYGTKDLGTIAVRYLTEKDVWAAIDPRAANHLTEAVKARQIGARSVVRIDELAEHGFKTTREALTLQVKDGTMTLDNFRARMRDFGAHEEYTAKAWRILQFNAKEGGVEKWWDQAKKAPGITAVNVEMSRRLVQKMAQVVGVSEEEFLARTMGGSFVNILSDDLIRATDSDYAGWESLFQKAEYMDSNWFSRDPVTGALTHAALTPEQAEAEFLRLAKEPPSRLAADQHGAYNDMQPLKFGEDVLDADGNVEKYARSLYIPGGQAALDDLEKPWTIWEAHLIRSQLVDPNELLDPAMKHAIYYKMWKAHQIDMTDPQGLYRLFNNTVMATLSAGLNLTRNELVSTRFRVNGMDHLKELADEAVTLREIIQATLPEGEVVRANDLGFAYSTRFDVAHYIGLDRVEAAAHDAYLPATAERIQHRARNARAYLALDKQTREQHATAMRATRRRDAVAGATTRAEAAVAKAEEDLATLRSAGDVDVVAVAEQAVGDALDQLNTVLLAQKDAEAALKAAVRGGDRQAIKKARIEVDKFGNRIKGRKKVVADARKALDERAVKAEDTAIAKAQQKLDDAIFKRDNIDPDEALAKMEREEADIIDSMDEEEIAKLDRKAEKASGRFTEWAIDQVTDILNDPAQGIDGLRTLEHTTEKILKDLRADPERMDAILKAAARLKADPLDIEARDVLRDLVPGARDLDQTIVWKPWNVEQAGEPYLKGLDGRVTGHGDKDMYAYIKNDDVAWRGFSTNAGMGNALMLAEDMTKNPKHFVRRTGPEYAPALPTPTFDRAAGAASDVPVPANITELEQAEIRSWQHASQANTALRRGDDAGPTVRVFDGLIDRTPATTVDQVLFRGVDPAELAAIRSQVGRTYEDLGYMPTASTEAEAFQQLGATVRIEVPKGSKVLPIDRISEAPLVSDEMVLPRGSHFAVREEPDGTLVMTLRPERDVNVAPTRQARARIEDDIRAHRADRDKIQAEVDKRIPAQGRGHYEDIVARIDKAIAGLEEQLGQVPAEAVHQEPLDEFAERVSHRTRGLSLKTGYFGVDLGDPINFERGVMDTHMVGELVDWMYYKVTNGGVGDEWTEFMSDLSSTKRKQVQSWLDKGAPRGAGTFDWSEATGTAVSFKATGPAKANLDIAVRDGDTKTVAAYVRKQISKVKGDLERERLQRLYRTDEELAELYGRDVKVLGGDYALFEEKMGIRKAEEALTDPTLDMHGHGGYQWKLWDDRRFVLDPEAATFAATHDMPRNEVIRFLASSDDTHYASGFMDKGGLRPVSEAGYRYLDPTVTLMAQRAAGGTGGTGALRGATMFKDPFEKIIALTEHANASTLPHELVHALLEPMLDPSGKQVVFDDLNRVIREANDQVDVKLIYAKAELDKLTQIVIDTQNTLLAAQRTAEEARGSATKATTAATTAESRLAKIELDLAKKTGALEQKVKDAEARRAAIHARLTPKGKPLSPSQRNPLLQTVDNELKRAQDSVDSLTSTRDAIRDSIEPLWDEANALQATAKSADEDVNIISSTLTRNKAEGVAARAEYDDLATTMPRTEKTVWDQDVSEHFADQFTTWLATGKAPSVEMRDVFAYFRKVLTQLKEWVTQENIKVSPEMDELFNKLMTPEMVENEAFANAIPFNATHEAMHAAARESVVAAEDAAHTNVQFRRGRSWMERSLNHPYMGIYPFSYMWGKVMPEMIRALALNPFGIPIPGMVEGATPGLGFLNAQRVWSAVELQKDTDPEFQKFMSDPKNDKFFRGASMLVPATPWDQPANFPLYARRLAEWGLENQDRREQGRPEKGFDVPKVAGEVASYAFGPASSADWMSDILKWGNSPILGGEGEGAGALQPSNLIIRGPGQKTMTVQESLQRASGQLQNTLGQ